MPRLLFGTIALVFSLALLFGLARPAHDGLAASPATPTPDPIEATATALGVPAKCVVQAFGAVDATPRASTPTPATAVGTPAAIEITTGDIYFFPCGVTIPADTPVTLTFQNVGTADSTLVIPALDIHADVFREGESRSVVVDAPPGVYIFYSDAPNQREAGRAGILNVVAAGTPVATTPTS
ncbi:MAG: cupredoxin domain-containing protein [Thermomicrobiales bacterium]|nr:cupredoxin domain-containing protein [Thermomicrobiales bacterium]